MVKKATSDYKIAVELVRRMEMGEKRIIEMPEKVKLFRTYLNITGQKNQKYFKTKKEGDKLIILRIERVEI